MYRALVSFSGQISMADGEVRDISDKALVKDLLNAKYIEEVKPQGKANPEEKHEEKVKEKPRKKSAKKKTTKKV